ncbi:MAG: adenylate/guanylate cyclase domain-containing protein [Actinobacteria bacterium]|nr:MAG: adenylate/guanylate cyclase domain-containing protein [Actinomycetota bacterium]
MPQERKVVTVLFADIVDSSGTTRSYDAEVLRAALARTFTRTREILIAHGATVEKFIGDAVMAVFGVPVAHEDDAERAVRAAIALRAEVSSSGEGRPRFTLRIGINTGEVVTGDVEGAEFLVTGSPVIVAARLEENAQHGEILVGPMTREITRGRIQYDTPRLIEAKGMGEVEAAAALEVLGALLPGALPHLGPFVGRDSELRLLGEMSRWSSCAASTRTSRWRARRVFRTATRSPTDHSKSSSAARPRSPRRMRATLRDRRSRRGSRGWRASTSRRPGRSRGS